MFGSQIFEIAIGLVFVYLLFSVICSALNEVVAWFFDLRAKTLRQGIEKLLADPAVKGLATSIYDHPLVKGLSQGGRPPSYITSRSFGLALMDVIVDVCRPVQAVTSPGTAQAQTAALQQGKLTIDRLRAAVVNLPSESPVKKIRLLSRIYGLILARGVVLTYGKERFPWRRRCGSHKNVWSPLASCC